jgi:hypothetical protein
MDHVQSRAVTIDSYPCPPVAGKAAGAPLTLTWHLSAVGALREVCVELHPTARQARAKPRRQARGFGDVRFPRRRDRKRLAEEFRTEEIARLEKNRRL